MEKKKREKKITNEKPISLYPLKTEEALKKLLTTPPPKKTIKKKNVKDENQKEF